MKKIKIMFTTAGALVLAAMPVLSQEGNTMCVHQDMDAWGCTIQGSPQCVSVSVADTCFPICGGGVVCVILCPGKPPSTVNMADCCDAG